MIRILAVTLAALIVAAPAFAGTVTGKDATSTKGHTVAQAAQPKDAKAKQAPAAKADEKAKKVEGHKTEAQPKR